jgi:hypothetical protein
MSEAMERPPAWTEADTEELFAALGRYWMTFQWIEGRLDQILLLGWGHENWNRSQKKLAGMTNYDKIKAVDTLVLKRRTLQEYTTSRLGSSILSLLWKPYIMNGTTVTRSPTRKSSLISQTRG